MKPSADNKGESAMLPVRNISGIESPFVPDSFPAALTIENPTLLCSSPGRAALAA
jgi:hypothetical protein